MRVTDTQIREEAGSNPAFRVEFCGDGGEVISVFMRQTGEVNRDNVIARARALMSEISALDTGEAEGRVS